MIVLDDDVGGFDDDSVVVAVMLIADDAAGGADHDASADESQYNFSGFHNDVPVPCFQFFLFQFYSFLPELTVASGRMCVYETG